MYLTVHALAGALIGREVNSVVLAFALGFISHFILDRIPHYDPDGAEDSLKSISQKIKLSKKERKFIAIVIIDFSILALLLLTFYVKDIFNFFNPVVAGIIGGMLPDLLQGLYYLTGNKYLKIFKDFHKRIHFDHEQRAISITNGMATQIIVLAFVVRVLIS